MPPVPRPRFRALLGERAPTGPKTRRPTIASVERRHVVSAEDARGALRRPRACAWSTRATPPANLRVRSLLDATGASPRRFVNLPRPGRGPCVSRRRRLCRCCPPPTMPAGSRRHGARWRSRRTWPTWGAHACASFVGRDRRARGARRRKAASTSSREPARRARTRPLPSAPTRTPRGPDALLTMVSPADAPPIDPRRRPPPDATSPPPSPAFGSTPTARCAPSPTPPACSRCSNSRSTPSDARAPAASSRRSQTRTTGAK